MVNLCWAQAPSSVSGTLVGIMIPVTFTLIEEQLLPKEIRQEKSKVNAGQDSKVRCILHSKCRTSFKREVHNV